jgi:hypothetical protein
MKFDLVESLGEGLFTHSRGFQHFDTGVIAQNARLPRAGAQRVGNFARPPMGVHIDHHLFFLRG